LEVFLKQVIQSYKDGKITLNEVPAPACKAGGVLVRNVASLISVGTEKLMIEMGQKSLLGKAKARPDLVRQAWAKAKKEGFLSVYKEAMNRLDEPIPLGYSAAGVVLEVGTGVQGFMPGDRVAVAGVGYASHAETVWVPENLCLPLPERVDFAAGAFLMLGGIALHGVREAGLTLGEKAVVIGLGLLGLLSVQLLRAQGCRVIGVDLDRGKGELAKTLGADLSLVPGEDDVEAAVDNLTGGCGADAIIITAASDTNQPILLAEGLARERARLVMVGMADLHLTRKTFWDKELSFTVTKASGPGSLTPLYEAKGYDYPIAYVRWTERRNLEAFLDLIAQERVKVEKLITHRFPIQEAVAAYDLILKNREPYIGVLFTYPPEHPQPDAEAPPHRTVWLEPSRSPSVGASPTAVGLIGGGMFTKNILLPALKTVQGVELAGVATTSGVTSQHLASKYGFAYATSDYQELLKDAAIGSVLITTRHNLHAPMVLEALAAGKHVFVEKPLCLTEAELSQIVAAYDGSRLLMVGFNRRYAPLTRELARFLSKRRSPLVMTYRINAGFIPPDHWVHDPEIGGGRLLGEGCHFTDFLSFVAQSEPVEVQVTAIGGEMGKYRSDDNLTWSLKFRNGSIGTILYTAQGSKAFSRERFEVFCEDSVAVLEDFRRLLLVQGGRTKRVNKFSMDMGYADELAFFFKALATPENYGSLFRSYVASTLATIKAEQAMKTGEPQTVKLPFPGPT
jgi:predicted dehydrogenase/threonine dehydrogenase-like Zn-dependent dehydrogenase